MIYCHLFHYVTVSIFQLKADQIYEGNIQKMIMENDKERQTIKKSLETKISILEDQLRTADHEKQTLVEEKVNMTRFIFNFFVNNFLVISGKG